MALIRRKRGDTYADVRSVTSELTGEILDITGYTFLLTLDELKYPENEDTQVYQLTGVILDAENGVVGFAPTKPQADRVGNFYYDIQLTDPDGAVRTVEEGKYKYTQDITK